MRKTKLARVPAVVTVPDMDKVISLLFDHTRYDAMEFRKPMMSAQEIEDIAWMAEFICNFSYISVTVNGVTEDWFFDKIIRDHDEFSQEQYALLLSRRIPFTRVNRAGERQELTYNKYVYFRFWPSSKVVMSPGFIAHATSDCNHHWGEVVALLEQS